MRAPKAKFAFKRKGAAAPRTATPTPAPAPPSAPATVPAESASGLAFSSKSHAYLTLDSLSTDSDATELAIADLDHCLVNLVPPTRTFSAIHVRNVTNSVLILGNVTGSVLLHDVQRCILVLRCHQFRMHTSKETDVYLSIPSNPIIEHSSRIRFSAYPDSLDLSETQSNSKHLAVQDFSHVRPTPSPNWSALPADKAIKEWPVEVGDTSVDEVVERLLVSLQ
ncbi:TBCC-domain-containing protein [Gloeophyllum trabeum ATCC 11539]|uniref:TBCC-domain-containing protein n=1 Tax=Gloeophyllum trabeum (strain ATCC 11539 / FP-39264 / Madison 617) TaxID=670483 RepID=S7PWA6_GLOTA|nr:TBCC-domain-containing protein [Gloeophyllum trabeum ATCC 11539]EPQ51906.1 TBCC-domain-containing protein [Gloeophyllum trabeum ATCC 11539]